MKGLCPVWRHKRAFNGIERNFIFQRRKARIQPCDPQNVALINDRDLIAALFRIEPAEKFIAGPVDRVQRDGVPVGNVVRVDLARHTDSGSDIPFPHRAHRASDHPPFP